MLYDKLFQLNHHLHSVSNHFNTLNLCMLIAYGLFVLTPIVCGFYVWDSCFSDKVIFSGFNQDLGAFS